MNYTNFPMIPRVIFGRGSFDQLSDILSPKRKNREAPFIFFVDDVFKKNSSLISRISLSYEDKIVFVSSKKSLNTDQVDALVEDIILQTKDRPSGIIGIGGGTLLDLAKAVAIMLTNKGEAKDYQGWDLVKSEAIYHVGIPTISGTGAEVSRMAMLTDPDKKLGITSDFIPFNQVILDSELTKSVPKEQWFYTGMECYIKSIEVLNSTHLNALSQSYSAMALKLCKQVFLENNFKDAILQEKLMIASWHAGLSIVYSQAGIAYAMSCGLSYVLGIKYGIGNCIVFNQLGEFYPEGVKLFIVMKDKHNIVLPEGVCANLSDSEFDKMIDISLDLELLWEHAIGENWRKTITRKKLKELYQRM